MKNVAAGVLTRTRMRDNIAPILGSLRWLPVVFRINLKRISLVYKAASGLAPSYTPRLTCAKICYKPARRSFSADLLNVPKITYKK